MKKKKVLSPVLEGERIYLRELNQKDVTDVYFRWMNDPQITQYTDSRSQQYSMEFLKKYVIDKQENDSEILMAIIVKQGKHHIGNIKLGPINSADNNADIGILIGERDFWGKGYASEAIGLLKNYAFDNLGLHKLTAGSIRSNAGSAKAFQNNGFSIEGVRKQHVFIDGHYVDGILLGLINK